MLGLPLAGVTSAGACSDACRAAFAATLPDSCRWFAWCNDELGCTAANGTLLLARHQCQLQSAACGEHLEVALSGVAGLTSGGPCWQGMHAGGHGACSAHAAAMAAWPAAQAAPGAVERRAGRSRLAVPPLLRAAAAAPAGFPVRRDGLLELSGFTTFPAQGISGGDLEW